MLQNIQPLRQNGPTVALSVGSTAHASVAVNAANTTQDGYAAFLNTGSTTVAVTMAPSGATAPTPVLPADGTPENVIVLPPSMNQPYILPAPGASFAVAAIGSGAGPSLVYITPMAP